MAKASRTKTPALNVSSIAEVDDLPVTTLEEALEQEEQEEEEEQKVSALDILNLNSSKSSLTPTVDPAKFKIFCVIRKINKMKFRLGMENTEEKYQLVPGTAQTFQPWKRGDKFLTGLEDKPEVRRRLEKLLGVSLDASSLYFENVTYRMEDRPQGQPLVIEDNYSGAYMEVIYHSMLASPLIANGLIEYTSGQKPEAEWYIENKEAEAEEEQKQIDIEMEAFNLFTEVSSTRRRELAKILGLKVWGLGDAVVKTLLWGYIKKGVKDVPPPQAIKNFLKEARLNDRDIAIKATVEDAIFYNVFRMNAARDWMYGDEALGANKEAIYAKLVSPRNAALRVSVEEKVELKREE